MLTVPSGSTSRRCLAWPSCIPVRTKEPGLVVLFLTRKSPSRFSSPSASFLLISPWYQGSAFSSSSIAASRALGETGLMHSTEAALLSTGPMDWFLRASSKGSAISICQQQVDPGRTNDKQYNVSDGNAKATLPEEGTRDKWQTDNIMRLIITSIWKHSPNLVMNPSDKSAFPRQLSAVPLPKIWAHPLSSWLEWLQFCMPPGAMHITQHQLSLEHWLASLTNTLSSE